MTRLLIALLLLVTAFSSAAARDPVVIYRCTDASGAVSLQNDAPCAKGSKQERRVMETVAESVPPPPANAPMAPEATLPLVVVEAGAETGAATVEAMPSAVGATNSAATLVPMSPPPPLFACRTSDRKEYFSDDPVPARRCAPLQVSGLDGSSGGGASACEWGTDTCAPVPDAALCQQWRQHAHDTRATLLFGRAEDPAATRVELERIETIISASTCEGDG